jgi:DNA-binding transcriptional ArsR family regulator
MSIDIPRLSKTLNDETRIRILRLLREKKSSSYSDLMQTLRITNTGRLNYHLKVLGDLIAKDGQSGAYALSEKDIIAINFLDKFQTLTSGITAGVSVAPAPYESTARTLRALLALELVAALAHYNAQYSQFGPEFQAEFLLLVFLLALFWGYLIQRTGGMIGSSLMHAGADVAIYLSILLSLL